MLLAAWAVGYYLMVYLPEKPDRLFASCRNHATFVGKALNRYVALHGGMAHVPGLPGDELVCRLDFQGALVNCHGGAPRQSYGGWQMVNASRKSWDQILATMKGQFVPVIWCGRVHRPPVRGSRPMRIVIGFDLEHTSVSSLEEFIAQETFEDADGKSQVHCFMVRIVYGMAEAELEQKLALINRILMENGEPETPLDVERGKDYGRLAKPYQSVE